MPTLRPILQSDTILRVSKHDKKPVRRTYALISLGCPKNLVDSERMVGLLQLDGYQLVADADGADLAIVNTCGFIGDARAESYFAIEEMLRLKQLGRLRGVIITGCLAERDKASLLERYPAIDRVVGVFARDEIVLAASGTTAGLSSSATCDTGSASAPPEPADQRLLFRPAPSRPLHDTGRHRLTLPHLAYLKIAEGCNRLCSFCSIPLMRGPYASKPIDEVITEAEELAADGVRELVLVAQDTTFYGLDLDGRPQLAVLLRRLEQVERLRWVRLMYLYPMHVTDELIEVLATSKKLLPYLDIPLQHINDDVLRRMRRRVDRRDTEELLDRLRNRIERLVLRTTMLVGFPGETEDQFTELLDFIRRRRFERLGVFAFCNEPGTPAEDLDGHLSEAVKQQRRNRLMAAQQEIAFAWNAEQAGRTLDVMIDGPVPGEPNAYIGRTYADAPDVDGQVFVTGQGLDSGQVVPCEVVAAQGYDLIAVNHS
jgi:ribosomal protein S12 methylthiotransferase